MAKRPVKTTTIREPIPEETERHSPPPPPLQKAIDEDIEEQTYSAFVGRFHGQQGCRVKVYRQTPRGRQYCFSGTPEEIESEETIRVYHAEQPYANEEGNYILYVTVNGELRDPFTINISPQVKSHTVTVPGPYGGMVANPEVTLLREQLNRLETRLTQQDRPPMLEMVEGLAKLDALRGGGGGGMNLDVVTRCIEIGTRMAGGGPADGGSWEGMLRDVVKENAPALIGLFQSITRRMTEQPPQPQPQAAQPPAVEQLPQQPPAVGDTMQPEEQERLIMQEALGYLKKKAQAHSDPGLYVDLIVDNREDPLYARLISQIVEKDFPAFAAIDPDIDKPEFREFFGFIHDRIRRVFKPKDTVATAGGGKSGNKKDAPSNGASSKASG